MALAGNTMDAREVTANLGGKWTGRQGSARCPAHDDRHPSLSVSDGANGKLLVHCHTGCEQIDVIEALRTRGLWPENQPTPQLRVHRGGRERNGMYAVP